MCVQTMICDSRMISGPGGGDCAGCVGRVAGGKKPCRVNRVHGYLGDKTSTNLKMMACINSSNSR